MGLAAALLALCLAAGSLGLLLPYRSISGIPQATFDDLVRYTKYSSGAYQLLCVRPLGNTLVESFLSIPTGTQGYVARDDSRKEIVVAFRGSQNFADVFTDLAIVLVPLLSPGTSDVGNASTHAGFLLAYNSVAYTVISTVRSELRSHPNYTVVSTGHSLGGAVASIGGLSLKSNFPNATVKVYTFGQPRTGNPAYAALVEQRVGCDNVFRAVHTYDGVPTIIPQALGYRHHSTEFWQTTEPATATGVKRCSAEEDPTCSNSIPSTGINLAHMTYFGQVMGLNPTVCL